MSIRNQLNQLDFFNDVSAGTIEKLEKAGKIISVPKGTVLIRAREPAASVFIQLTGKSMVYNLTHHGRRKILFVFGRGSLLSEHISNRQNASCFCETIDPSDVYVCPSVDFVKIMAEDFKLTQAVLEAQERKIWRLSHQLKNTTSSIQLERKLAAKLWKLSRDFGIKTDEGIEIDMNMTITFLADMLGVPRETTSRVCSTLTEVGLIKMKRKRIIISDPEKMSLFYKDGKIE